MLAAFITGFAEQAKEEIDKTNKEISDRVIAGMAGAIKKREAALEAAKEREDKGREQARALRALSGNKLTQSQIIGILHSGEANTVIESLRKQSVGPEELKRLFVPADKDAQADLEQYITDLGRLTGQAPARTEMERGAFGIQTRAGEAARARGIAQAAPMGITEENLYQTKAVAPGGVEGTLDLDVLKDAAKDTMEIRIDQAARSVADAETDEDKQTAQDELDRLVAIQARTKPKDKDGKISQSDIRSTIKRRLEAIARAHISGDYTTTNDGSINIHSTKGRNTFLAKITEGLTPLLKSYIDAYKDDQGRVPNEVRFAWEAEGAMFNDKGQFTGFNASLFPVTEQPDPGEGLKETPPSPPAGDTRPSPGSRSGMGGTGQTPAPGKNYTPEQLKAATIKAIDANPQQRDQLIKQYEDATGLKFNG